MKTLKKTLCLVLAMVMVFGLCVTSASAKLDAYEDKDTINYAEAVDVMTGIGVLAGDARGFRPGDDITRAEAAKIIAYIMIGDSDRADALKATSDPFPDVPASHWAAGYISYCATADIIAGMGDGYHPNDNVTGLQFAKMLLKALGYGVNDEYIGTDWAINVSRDALRLGIFEKNTSGANNNKANREECALYAFNAIAGAKNYRGIEKVSYSALLGGYITSTGIGAYTGTDSPDANMGETFARDFKLEKEDNEEDDFGRDTGHHWILTTSKRPVITAEYEANEFLKANADDEIWATFTTGVTGADIYNVLGSDVSKTSTTLELYVNGIHTGYGYDREQRWTTDTVDGEEVTVAVYKDLTGTTSSAPEKILLVNFKKSNDKTLEGTGNGVQTFVYAKYVYGELHVKICIVDTYLAQVTRVTAASDNKDAETTVKLIRKWDSGNGYTIPANVYTYETDEFKKDDYVLVTIADKDGVVAYNDEGDRLDDGDTNLAKDSQGDVVGEVQTMIPAITKSAEVTKFSKRNNDVSIVADDTTYVAAKDSAGDYRANLENEEYSGDTGVKDAAFISNVIVNGEEHTLFLDEFGYVIATSDFAVGTNYVYVAQFGVKISTAPSLTDKFNLMAHVYYDDGTDEIVTVDSTKGIFANTHKLSTKTIEQIEEVYGKEFDRGFNDLGEVFEIGLYSLTTEKGKAVLHKADTDQGDDYIKYICMANSVPTPEPLEDPDPSHSKYAGEDGDDDTENHDTDSGALANDTTYAKDVTTGGPAIGEYVSKGQARIDKNKAENRANDNTVFFYVSGTYGEDDFNVTVYTGINSVPSTKYDDRLDSALSEYAFATKNGTLNTHAVRAAVVDAKAKGETGTIVYFFGGTLDTANFDKLSSKVVRYKVYGGDQIDYLEIEYDSYGDADDAISSHKMPGFVKVKDGKLEYIVDKTNGYRDIPFDKDPTALGLNPFYYVKKDGSVYYVNLAELVDIVGILKHTAGADVVIKDGEGGDAVDEKDTISAEAVLMPLYDIESVVDLRTSNDKSDGGGRIDDVDDLLNVFESILLNHDGDIDTAAKNVKIDGLRVAMSFTGNDDSDRTNVIKTIYILDNIACDPEGAPNDPGTDGEYIDLNHSKTIAQAAEDVEP